MLKNRAIIYLLCTIFLSVPAWESNAQEADEYVLESIEVPKGNPIRTETNVPRLYIEIEKNGTLEGTSEAGGQAEVNCNVVRALFRRRKGTAVVVIPLISLPS